MLCYRARLCFGSRLANLLRHVGRLEVLVCFRFLAPRQAHHLYTAQPPITLRLPQTPRTSPRLQCTRRTMVSMFSGAALPVVSLLFSWFLALPVRHFGGIRTRGLHRPCRWHSTRGEAFYTGGAAGGVIRERKLGVIIHLSRSYGPGSLLSIDSTVVSRIECVHPTRDT